MSGINWQEARYDEVFDETCASIRSQLDNEECTLDEVKSDLSSLKSDSESGFVAKSEIAKIENDAKISAYETVIKEFEELN